MVPRGGDRRVRRTALRRAARSSALRNYREIAYCRVLPDTRGAAPPSLSGRSSHTRRAARRSHRPTRRGPGRARRARRARAGPRRGSPQHSRGRSTRVPRSDSSGSEAPRSRRCRRGCPAAGRRMRASGTARRTWLAARLEAERRLRPARRAVRRRTFVRATLVGSTEARRARREARTSRSAP